MPKEQPERILIVDDDRDILKAAGLYLKQYFGFIDAESNPNNIPKRLDKVDFDVVLLDMNFTDNANTGEEGFRWLQKIQEIDPTVAVVLITAYGDVEKAVKAIKLGATDFILKPWKNEKLHATINAALKLTQSRRETDALRDRQKHINAHIVSGYQDMVGQSDAMQGVYATIEKVAKTDANVLLTGENGTGKELAARALHRRSGRSDEVFINVDIGSLSENLFESELFGHTKGAFTDAKEARPGRFEVADGGTLFLDEIGNIPLSLQPKLLSVIENHNVTRIGSNEPREIDIRLTCATNESIEKLSDPNRFRQDLLFRINTIHIPIPALRERKEDIPLLTRHFIDKYQKKYGKEIQSVSDSVMRELKSYTWPGNVRELEHAVERAIIMTDNSVLKSSDFLRGEFKTDDAPENANYNLKEVEEAAVRNVLQKHDRNISRAAEELGISRAALYRRIEKYDL